ncbi:MAG: hypothetical protein JNM33_15705 [Rubrivivax sp.]|nr:hypothetical protein [Rubrivivax sp.]
MSTYSMTYGRPARLDTKPFFDRIRQGFSAMLDMPRRLDAWMEARDQARMSAQDVLALARSMEDSDPGFAADLRGAAMRSIDLH